MFCLKESRKGKVNIAEILYFLFVIGACLGVVMAKVNIDDIIDINGSVIGFFFIYFLPALLHVKCMYFSKGKKPVPPQLLDTNTDIDEAEAKQKEITAGQEVELVVATDNNNMTRQAPLLSTLSDNNNSKSTRKGSTMREGQEGELLLDEDELLNTYYYCDCDNSVLPVWRKVGEMAMMVIMVGLGIFIMVNGIQTVAS